MKQPPPLLACRDLGCVRGGAELLVQINLELHPGELVGIIGPNGAGKTTLLRHLSGYLPASRGQVLLAGRPLERWKDRDRAKMIAWLGQDLPQGLPMTLRELVELGRYPHVHGLAGLSADDRALVQDTLVFVGLVQRADQDFDSLSGGEKQRGLFARALAQDTPILLLDEASASLDMAQEHRLFAMVRELCAEGKAVMAAIHNINLAAEYCQRLLVMVQGRIVADGSPAELLNSASLKDWFDFDALVTSNAATGTALIQHAPPRQEAADQALVHLIGGAGSALGPTRLLARMGFRLSGGIAHGLDRDLALWQGLGIPHVAVAPFSPIDDADFAQARAMVEAADFVILCDFPFGPGNRRNLELAAAARNLIVLRSDKAERRAFFEPGLEDAWQALLKAPDRTVVSLDWSEFVHLIETGGGGAFRRSTGRG